jgi:hypothetical protein
MSAVTSDGGTFGDMSNGAAGVCSLGKTGSYRRIVKRMRLTRSRHREASKVRRAGLAL